MKELAFFFFGFTLGSMAGRNHCERVCRCDSLVYYRKVQDSTLPSSPLPNHAATATAAALETPIPLLHHK